MAMISSTDNWSSDSGEAEDSDSFQAGRVPLRENSRLLKLHSSPEHGIG